MRNHGFILTDKGRVLSPAYDINPLIDKDGLALNIDMYNNALDYDLAKSIGAFFRMNNSKMDSIIEKVLSVVSTWNKVAQSIGISNAE